ncbi:unnamed protein product [Phytophthora fragariaefolia]|uniref:Unnamed protein product n=1 Tax=Phytophthora fragariaefolia TaxID=1490495 RepID=A0A9W6U5C8_9STRA|nr:unnamed protein product [Phytophthora fragariaefolia]
MGKQAAYEAAQKQMPAPSQSTAAVEGTAAVNTEQAGGVNVTVPADTEQAGGLDITVAVDTEQTGDDNETVPADTEQAGGGNVTVAADTEHAGGMEDGAAANAEPYTAGLPNGEIALDAFDSPHFIDAMRAESRVYQRSCRCPCRFIGLL